MSGYSYDSMAVPAEVSDEQIIEGVRKGAAGLRRVDAIKEAIRRGGDLKFRVLRETITDRTSPPELRAISALALGREPRPENEALLLGALSDPDPSVVRRAAEGLGKLGTAKAAEKLKAMVVPAEGAVGRAVAFAKVLLSYRLGTGESRLEAPRSTEVLKLKEAEELKPGPVDAMVIRKAGTEMRRELPGIRPSLRSSTLLHCNGDDLILMLTEEVEEAVAHPEAGMRDVVATVILKRSAEGHYPLHEYILAHPSKGGAELFGVRPGGVVVHHGTATLERGVWQFELLALNTVYSRAIEVKGQSVPGAGQLQLTSVRVETGPAAKQKKPAVPKKMLVVVPAPLAAPTSAPKPMSAKKKLAKRAAKRTTR